MSTKSRNIANKQRYKYDDDDQDRRRVKRRNPEIRRPTRNWTKAWTEYEARRDTEDDS